MVSYKHKLFLILLSVGLFLGVSNPADVEAYSYGNLSGTTINFNNITDTTNSPGDPDGLFGGIYGPMVVGDQLLFFPNNFSSSSSNGSADTTSSTLQIDLVPNTGTFIETIRIQEIGDYALTGSGTNATQAQISGLLTITPIGGGGSTQTDFFSASYELPPASSGPVTGYWEITLTNPAPRAILSFNNVLQTSSESGTTSFIQKKVIDGPAIGIIVNPVPVPGAIWLLASGFIALAGFRRKFGR